jgi:hypothetical protein
MFTDLQILDDDKYSFLVTGLKHLEYISRIRITNNNYSEIWTIIGCQTVKQKYSKNCRINHWKTECHLQCKKCIVNVQYSMSIDRPHRENLHDNQGGLSESSLLRSDGSWAVWGEA